MYGNVVFTLSGLQSKQHNLIVKTYDRNPIDSSAYSLTNIQLRSNIITNNINISGGSYKNIDGQLVYSVLANENIVLSAQIASQSTITSLNFWEVEYLQDGTYIKTRLISADTTAPYVVNTNFASSRVLTNGISTYKYYGVLADAIDVDGYVPTSNVIDLKSYAASLFHSSFR